MPTDVDAGYECNPHIRSLLLSLIMGRLLGNPKTINWIPFETSSGTIFDGC